MAPLNPGQISDHPWTPIVTLAPWAVVIGGLATHVTLRAAASRSTGNARHSPSPCPLSLHCPDIGSLDPLRPNSTMRRSVAHLCCVYDKCTIIGVNMLYNKSNAYNEPATSQRAESTTDVNQSTRSPYSKSTDAQVHNKSTTNQGNGVAVSRRG